MYHTCVTYIALVGAPISATCEPICTLLGAKWEPIGSEGVNTIEDAEVHTIQKYQQYLELDSLKSGDSILEIGNGWGSLCLTNAAKYPELQFFSFSNSETQIEYIKSQIEKRQLKNLTVWRQDIDEFIKSSDEMANKFSRVVSIECIEHCRNYQELFKGIAGLLKDDGFTFFQILGHSKYSYLMNKIVGWVETFLQAEQFLLCIYFIILIMTL